MTGDRATSLLSSWLLSLLLLLVDADADGDVRCGFGFLTVVLEPRTENLFRVRK